MARTKSAYRRFKDGGSVLADTPPGVSVAIDTDATPKEIADDPSAALLKQIEALRQSEKTAKDRAAQIAESPSPQSHDQILEQWQRAGLSDAQARFLRANPSMIGLPSVLEAATAYAHHRGHAVDTPEYFEAVKSNFEKHINPPEDTSEAEPVAVKVHKYGEPSEASPSRASASMFSAPVSRETQANGSYNSYGDRPGRVTLSVAQKEAARFAGVSEADYAKGVLELRERKASGDYS